MLDLGLSKAPFLYHTSGNLFCTGYVMVFAKKILPSSEGVCK